MRARTKALWWIARSLVVDLRYGASLAGNRGTRQREAGAYNVVNTPYAVLPHIFAGRIGPDDVLVDIGCGKGRVINWWLNVGLTNRLVGIEMDPEVAAATAHRLRRHENVEIIQGDATVVVPEDATLLYMYNPFNAEVMQRFKAMLVERFRERGITVLYWNVAHVDLWRADPRWDVEVIELDRVADPRVGGSHGRYAVMELAPQRVEYEGARTMARPRAR